MTVDELIATLEKATGPDRRIDQELLLLAHPLWLRAIEPEFLIDPNRPVGDLLIGVPEYTASIDAALTLEPRDWWTRVENDGYAMCGPARGMSLDPNTVPHSYCENRPAIAVCLVKLRAQKRIAGGFKMTSSDVSLEVNDAYHLCSRR